jgi:Fic family protein
VSDDQRHSRAADPDLIQDPLQKAKTEAANGLRQYDAGLAVIQTALERGSFKLRPSTILGLHREALTGLSSYAGNWRPSTVEIQGSKHTPPSNVLVPELVEEMCDYVNEKWDAATAFHLSAYVMWRINWIHPFADGNGRTSHIASYVILSIRSGFVLPGTTTIPDQIVSNRKPYFDALDAADGAYKDGQRIDVSKMETLLDGMFARQLTSAYEAAGGKLPNV